LQIGYNALIALA